MHPFVRAASAVAVFAALGSGASARVRRSTAVPVAAPAVAAELPVFCPPRTIPDGPVCVPVPRAAPSSPPPRLPLPSRERAGDVLVPRLPDRSPDFAAYAWPVRDAAVTDLGGGAVAVASGVGAEVHAAELEGAEGATEVLFVGVEGGPVVATRHLVRESGRLREYVVLYRDLDALGPAAVAGSPLAASDVIAHLGEGVSPALRLEVRRVRDGVRLHPVDLRKLADAAFAIPCDPRNVLAERRGQGASL